MDKISNKKTGENCPHVRLFYYDIQEITDKSSKDLDSISYRLMEESGDLMDRRIIQDIDSLILRTETDVESIDNSDEESNFLVVPVVCVQKLIKTSDEEEIVLQIVGI